MNIVRNLNDFLAIGGTTNCGGLHLNTTCASYGCTHTTTEGLNWGTGGSPVGHIRLPLPPDKTDLYVGYQDAYANPDHVRCLISQGYTPLIQGPLLSNGGDTNWAVTYGGGSGLFLHCREDASVGEIRYVFVR